MERGVIPESPEAQRCVPESPPRRAFPSMRPGGPAMTETSCSLSDDDDEPPSRARRATGRRAGLAPGRRIDGSLGPARIDGKARRGGLSGTQRCWASGDSGMTPRSIVFQSCGRFCALRRLLPLLPQNQPCDGVLIAACGSSAGRGVLLTSCAAYTV